MSRSSSGPSMTACTALAHPHTSAWCSGGQSTTASSDAASASCWLVQSATTLSRASTSMMKSCRTSSENVLPSPGRPAHAATILFTACSVWLTIPPCKPDTSVKSRANSATVRWTQLSSRYASNTVWPGKGLYGDRLRARTRVRVLMSSLARCRIRLQALSIGVRVTVGALL